MCGNCVVRRIPIVFRLVLPLVLQAVLSSSAVGVIRIVFRMDDYCNGVNPATMEEVFSTFQSKSLSLVVGVVPAAAIDGNLNSTGTAHSVLAKVHGELLARWVKVGVVELGVHGFEHRNRGGSVRSEFAGVELEKQFELMKHGCDVIGERTGARPHVFLPPWNTFDFLTLQAAITNSIDVVSAVASVPVDRDGASDGLTFLPVSGGLLVSEKALSDARRSGDVNPVIVLQFHADDFRPDAKDRLTIGRLRAILSGLGSMSDVRIVSMREIRASPENPTIGDFRRLEKWKVRWRSQRPWVPRVLRVDADTRFPSEVVFSPGHLDTTVRNYLLCVGLFFTVSAGVLVAGVVLILRLMRRAKAATP